MFEQNRQTIIVYISIQQDITDNNKSLCKICLDYQIGIAFIPCGHTSCEQCCLNIKNDTCPFCKCEMKSKQKIFLQKLCVMDVILLNLFIIIALLSSTKCCVSMYLVIMIILFLFLQIIHIRFDDEKKFLEKNFDAIYSYYL